MSDTKGNESVADLTRHALNAKEKDLVMTKMKALQAYQESQARLTRANIELLDAGIRPELGLMCW